MKRALVNAATLGQSVSQFPIDSLLTDRDVAAITKLSVASIRRRRRLKQSPRFIKIGAAIRYRSADVQSWLESHPVLGIPAEHA